VTRLKKTTDSKETHDMTPADQKRRAVWGALAGCLWMGGALCAPPQSDPMKAYYGNTMISRHSDGQVFEVWFDKDRTFVVMHNGKVEVKGTYTVEEGKVCMVVDPSKPADCHPFKANLKIGESWIATTPNGRSELSLKAGRAKSS
jgi:ferric-dicitrate binding protein FerR (iron transport regulator)